ncbi:MAG: Rrf2 family transcriptional regulator [Armatimonadetes bacterium]|jgi:Rrf2 family protein|nr:Rrf2 family transcriptional regulator [Armatimonadota bacterium]
MEITRQADYAVRAVLELALRDPEVRVPREEIAAEHGIPAPFLTKIVARLAAEGILDTRRGVKGGVRLARPAAQITLLEVIEAIDGPVLLNRCTRRPAECPRDNHCVVHRLWTALRDDLRGRLARVDFGALARQVRTATDSTLARAKGG